MTFYCKTTGQYIQEGTPFTINGVQYPANFLNLSTPTEKTAIGLEEVIATNNPSNDKFYWVSSSLSGAELTYTNTPKDLDTCKSTEVSATRATAYSILLPSDWMVVKAFETSTPMDAAWSTWRSTIRAETEAQITAINACTTIEELAALPNVSWSNDPNYVEPTVEPVAP